jgi:AraC-like DNA-binding protein
LKGNRFKYVTASEEDKEWGLYLNVAGEAIIEKHTNYPPGGHPSGYNFNFHQGRVLHEYQVNYITEGYGIFENSFGKFRITPGTIIILFPGEWHRYRPLKKTGWKEHYIGFAGDMVQKLLKPEFFKKETPIIKVDFRKDLQDTFYQILENVLNEKTGYQQICTGLSVAYIGQIISSIKNKEFEGKDIEKKIQRACFIIRESLNRKINAVEIANELNVGYSYFRRMFKKYTGISPVQYHIQLRLKKAESMLAIKDKPVKEIAFELGFQSIFHFSQLFKQKTGLSPTAMRNFASKNKYQV